MSTIKTLVNESSVEDFIANLEDKTKQADTRTLLNFYAAATGEPPKMWGASIIGFGQYHYKSERSSQEGDWPLAAFSPRKQSLTLYLLQPGQDYSDLLSKLGKHKTAKACVYIKKLSDVDEAVLQTLIARSYHDAKKLLGPK